MEPFTLHHPEGFLPGGFQRGALRVTPDTGSPIAETGMLSPSFAAVQSASAMVRVSPEVCAPVPADQIRAVAPAEKTIHQRVCFMELLDPLLLDVPLRILAETAVRAQEHLAGLLVALKLPLKQRNGDFAKIAAIGLSVCAAMPDAIFVCAECRHFGDALEIVIGVCKRDISRIAGNVEHGRVKFVQLFFRNDFRDRKSTRLNS